VVGFWILLGLAATPGVLRLRVETSTASVLDRTGPDWERYQESLLLFGGDEDVVVAIPAARPFEREVLGRVISVSEKLLRVPGIERVDSAATTPVVERDKSGSIIVGPILTSHAIQPEHLGETQRRLAESSLLRGLLVAADGLTFGIRARVSADSRDYPRVMREVADLARQEGAWVSGVPIFREEASHRTRSELALFVPATILVVALVLLVVLRSFSAVGLTLGVAAAGTWLVLGAMGQLGVPLMLSTAILPSVLLAMGAAASVHLLCETSRARSRDVLLSRASIVSGPIIVSGATTALAFLTGATVPIPAIRYVAIFGALGALVLAFATITLGSALLAVGAGLQDEPRLLVLVRNRLGVAVLAGVRRWPRRYAVGWLVACLLAVWGASRVVAETDVTSWFPRGGEVRDSYEAIRERLVGVSPINILIRSPSGRSVADATSLGRIGELTAFLESLPDVGKATSISTLLGDVHRATNPEAGGEVPFEDAMIEQYLLLLEGTEDVRELVTQDRAVANVVVRVSNNGSEHLLDVASRAVEWWKTWGDGESEVVPTGIMFEFARAERAIAQGQLVGLALDCAALLGLYLILFRGIALALIALAPSVAAIGLTFGALGLLGAPLDAGTVFVGSLALGVTVDETVHFVLAFRHGLRNGRGVVDAIAAGFGRVFPALVLTTGVLALGFGVLTASSFEFIKKLGMLTAAAMAVCVAANSTLIPALLFVGGRIWRRNSG
jgi:hypothetical protein